MTQSDIEKSISSIDIDTMNSDELSIKIKDMNAAIFGYNLPKRHTVTCIYNGETLTTTLGRALAACILIMPLKEINDTTNLVNIFNSTIHDDISNHMNVIIDTLTAYKVDQHEICNKVSHALEQLADLGANFNMVEGNTISIYDIVQLCNKNPEISELLNFDIPNNLQYKEIEELVQSKVDRLVTLIKQDDSSSTANLLRSNSMINVKQFGQLLVNVSLKPSLSGDIIPEPINTSFLRGLRNVQDFYINMTGARKASITNAKEVSSSGYLARKASISILNHMLVDVDECDTLYPIIFHVDSHDTLKRLDKRSIINDAGDLEYIDNWSNFSHLIDTDVYLYSPTTCTAENGVCKRCYGGLSKVNGDRHIGLIAVFLLTAVLTQRLLSAKHLLQTAASKINLGETFHTYFDISGANVVASELVDSIILNREDVEDDIDGFPSTKRVTVVLENDQRVSIAIDDEIRLLDGDIVSLNNSEDGKIVINVEKDSTIFMLNIENTELSAPVKAILSLLEKSDRGIDNLIEPIMQRFSELLNDSKISLNLVHAELIIRSLVRDIDDHSVMPNFSEDAYNTDNEIVFPEHTVLRLTKGILTDSLANSLSFERYKEQLLDAKTFDKDSHSVLDAMFLS